MENRNIQNTQQPRWKSWAVWASVLGALGLALQAMGVLEMWGLDAQEWDAVVTAVGTILVTFGILNNPTNKEAF